MHEVCASLDVLGVIKETSILLESDAAGDAAMTLKVMRAPKAPAVRFQPLSANFV